jgi:alpha-L-fucosidase
VVAAFKVGLDKKCAVLDYEWGGTPDITDYYWLIDDAIISSSWCFKEGIRYCRLKYFTYFYICLKYTLINYLLMPYNYEKKN